MKIMAAISDKEMGEMLLDHLSKRIWSNETEIHFVNVITWSPSKKEKEAWPGLTEYAEAQETEAYELLDEISKRFQRSSPNCVVLNSVLHGHVGEQLLFYSLQKHIDETIVASHQRSELGKFLFGNVSSELLQNLPSALTVIKKARPAASTQEKNQEEEEAKRLKAYALEFHE